MRYPVTHSAPDRPGHATLSGSLAGLADATTAGIIAAAIIREAKQWVSVVEDPVGSNRGNAITATGGSSRTIDAIHLLYRGTSWKPVMPPSKNASDIANLAYCAEWVWVVHHLAWQNCLTGYGTVTNPFPSYAEVFGNALNSLNRAKSRIPVSTTPKIGSSFYRTSSSSSSAGSSGHMGIVIAVDPSKRVFFTIEANQGETHRVDQYSYSFDDVAKYGFQFIHVPDIAAPATIALKENCREIASTPPATSGGSTGSSSTPPETGTASHSRRSSSSGTTGSGTPTGSTTGTSSRKISSCLAINAPSTILPYSTLADPRIAADIMGVNTPWGKITSRSDYQGYAVGRPLNDPKTGNPNYANERDRYSGFGVFHDGNYQMYIVVNSDDASAGRYAALKKMFGGDVYELVYNVPAGSGWVETAAYSLTGQIPAKGSNMFLTGSNLPQELFSPYRYGQQRDTFDQFSQSGDPFLEKIKWQPVGQSQEDWEKITRNPFHAIRYIEKRVGESRIKLSKPILIRIYHEKAVGVLEMIDEVMRIATPFIAFASPFIGPLAKPVGDTLNKITALTGSIKSLSTKGFSFNSIAEITDVLRIAKNIGDTVLPSDWQAVVEDKLKQFSRESGIESTINWVAEKGRNLYDLGKGLDNKLRTAVQQLGIDPAKITGDITAFVKEIERGDTYRAIMGSYYGLDRANQVAQGFQTITLIERISKQLNSGRLLMDIADSEFSTVTQIPALQTLLINGSAGTALSAIPKINDLAESILHYAGADFASQKSDLDSLIVRAAFLKLGMGVPVEQGAFNTLTLDALKYRAQEFAKEWVDNKLQRELVLPHSLTEEQQICYGEEICRSGFNIKVRAGKASIACKDPFLDPGVNFPSIGIPNMSPNTSTFTVATPTTSTDSIPRLPKIEIPAGGTSITATPTVATPVVGTPVTRLPKLDVPTVDTAMTPPIVDTPITRLPKLDVPAFNPNISTTPLPGTDNPSAACPPGMRWNGVMCAPIVPDQPTQREVPPVEEFTVGCPPGFHMENGKCVPDTPVEVQSCPPGFHMENGKCVPDVPPEVQACPPGFHMQFGKCVPDTPPPVDSGCPPGYHLESGRCVPDNPPPVVVPSTPVVPAVPTPAPTPALPPQQPVVQQPVAPAQPCQQQKQCSSCCDDDCGCGCDGLNDSLLSKLRPRRSRGFR